MNVSYALPIACLCGYLLGSLPVAVWVARWRGVDIFTVGTRNPGAANVFRNVGPPWGALVWLGDMGKGAAAVGIGLSLGLRPEVALAGGLAAIVGHWHSLFLGFRGGTGLATLIGVTVMAAPWPGMLAFAIGALLVAVWRNTGWASALSYAAYIALAMSLGQGYALPWAIVGLAVIVTARARVVERRGKRDVVTSAHALPP